MRRLVEEAGLAGEFEIDSAGILSYHRGELPDARMRAHAVRRGYELTHRSRPVTTDDFFHFDLIIGMDARNMDDLRERAPSPVEWNKLRRMTDFCTSHPYADHVPDPYYGGSEGFEYVLEVRARPAGGCLCRSAGTAERAGCMNAVWGVSFRGSSWGRYSQALRSLPPSAWKWGATRLEISSPAPKGKRVCHRWKTGCLLSVTARDIRRRSAVCRC